MFSASGPVDLPGYHAGLIGEALSLAEPVRHLVYSPLFEAWEAPFGVTGSCGSHSLAVTPDRFVVSRDPHREGQERSVRSIPFDRVLSIELGHALVLGWLRIRFAENHVALDETIFFASSGIRHFQAAVRAYRSRLAEPLPLAALDPARRECGDEEPRWLSAEWSGLLLQGEMPLSFVRSSESFATNAGRRGSRSACVSPWSVAVLTERSLLRVESQRPLHPGDLVFGVNTTLVDRSVIRGCRIEGEAAHDAMMRHLAVCAGLDDATLRLDIPFDERSLDSARAVAASLALHGAVASP